MAKTNSKKAPAKKAAPKKAAPAAPKAAAPAPAAFKNPAAGDQVRYVMTEDECLNHNRPAGTILSVTAEQVMQDGQRVLIKGEPRQGFAWRRHADYDASKRPGSWHW
jgi:hypothetical protein